MLNQVFVTAFKIGSNIGFAAGKWFDLSDYSSEDELREDAEKFLAEEYGETSPEICYSDYSLCHSDKLHKDLISETNIDQGVFEYAALDEDTQEVVSNFIDGIGTHYMSLSEAIEKAQDNFKGRYISDESFAKSYHGEVGISGINKDAKYIDWKKVAKDLMQDFIGSNGFYYNGSF